MRRALWLVVRFQVSFRPPPGRAAWSSFVAEQVRLPAWGFEGRRGGAMVFVRAAEPLTGHGEATARVFFDPLGPEARLEVAMRGRFTEDHEQQPPLAALQHLVEEGEALLRLLGCRVPRARFVEAKRTRRQPTK